MTSMHSAADAAHAAAGRLEIRLAHMVPIFLLPDNLPQVSCDFLIGGLIAQTRPQIVLGYAKKAGADLTVRGKANSVAMTAKRLGHGSDDPDLRMGSPYGPALRRFGFVQR